MGLLTLALACRAAKVDAPEVPAGDTGVPVGLDSQAETGTTDPADDTGACTPARLYADLDGDGYGDANAPIDACPGEGRVADATDCDDTRADVSPGATETCDDVDDDCDGAVDEDLATTVRYADADGDGWGDPDATTESCHDDVGVANALDCDDTDPVEPVQVEAGADDAVADGTSAAPFSSVQAGIEAARVCVHVHAGTYVEDVDFVGKEIEVLGVDGADVTVLQGTGAAPVVTFSSGEGSEAVLSGFTITGGGGRVARSCGDDACTNTITTYAGGGLYVSGAWPTLEDLVVADNVLPPFAQTPSEVGQDYVFSYGGGLYVTADGSPDLRWIEFRDNSASTGGGAWIGGTAAVTNSVFTRNTTDGWLGGGAITLSEGMLDLVNVTAYDNPGNASIFTLGVAELSIRSSILVEGGGQACLSGEASAVFSMDYSDAYACDEGIYGKWSPLHGTGNLASDPMFVDAAGGDFTLDAGSPCVDAGDPGGAYDDGDGTRNDMGEFGGPNGGW